ncbi:hypothetical protein [Sporolactobacillus spathodeae]|uniref:Prealbumin-like fold domain-containing protein n=1 Tax=Sporolactobacillus spathodeae TaxID=1465502 RepID=A0ABS2Q7G4_9BACL|nr:hypothetical protein [Sporolactobacillus spathodeae]MBM7657715.1 hypothetical protein [Sporolactobacillus spathodeae]
MIKVKSKFFLFMVSLLSFSLIVFLFQPTISSAASNDEQNISQTANAVNSATSSSDIVKPSEQNGNLTATVSGKTEKVTVPDNSQNPINLTDKEDPANDMSITLPDQEASSDATKTKYGTVVYDNSDNDFGLAVQPTVDGVKTLITIKDNESPKSYDFTMDLPEGNKLVTSADYLGAQNDTGEVYVVDSDNIVTGIFRPAWAKDANGNFIPTHYEVHGNTITQIIDTNANTVYPVVADPNWGKIAACSAAIAWFIGSNLFAAAKIIKAKKYIKELGGLWEASKLLTRATSWEEKLRIGGNAFKSLAATITGVGGLAVCVKWK